MTKNQQSPQRQFIEKNLDISPKELTEMVLSKFGGDAYNVRHMVDKAKAKRKRDSGQAPVSAKAQPTVAIKGRSTAELFSAFDDIQKLLNAAQSIKPGEYLTDDEMRTRIQVSRPRWLSVSEHPKVARWRYVLPNRRTVWMSQQDQAALNKRINLEY